MAASDAAAKALDDLHLSKTKELKGVRINSAMRLFPFLTLTDREKRFSYCCRKEISKEMARRRGFPAKCSKHRRYTPQCAIGKGSPREAPEIFRYDGVSIHERYSSCGPQFLCQQDRVHCGMGKNAGQEGSVPDGFPLYRHAH